MANEQARAALSLERGRQAAQMSGKERSDYVAGSANIDKNYDQMQTNTSATGNMLQRKQVLGSLSKGGPVNKTGLYKLHAGEKVLNRSQNARARLKKY